MNGVQECDLNQQTGLWILYSRPDDGPEKTDVEQPPGPACSLSDMTYDN